MIIRKGEGHTHNLAGMRTCDNGVPASGFRKGAKIPWKLPD